MIFIHHSIQDANFIFVCHCKYSSISYHVTMFQLFDVEEYHELKLGQWSFNVTENGPMCMVLYLCSIMVDMHASNVNTNLLHYWIQSGKSQRVCTAGSLIPMQHSHSYPGNSM